MVTRYRILQTIEVEVEDEITFVQWAAAQGKLSQRPQTHVIHALGQVLQHPFQGVPGVRLREAHMSIDLDA
jgi:hypothetical protein